MPFGYPVEPNFDLAKEQRWNRAGWVLLGGAVLSIVYDFSGGPFGVRVFQAWIATSLCYGASVYVKRRKDLSKWWLWKGILATVPLHLAYLIALFWLDAAFPQVMNKAVAFIPILAIAYAIESNFVDWIVDRFEPSSADLLP